MAIENGDLQQRIAAALRRAETAERATAEYQERRLEAERATAEHRERRLEAERATEAAERAIQKMEQLYSGTFYATINEVWKPKSVHYNRQHFSKLFRIKCPKMYKATVEAARNSKYNPADEPSLTSSTMKKNETWPTDIFGEAVLHAQIAHLVPASSEYASMYDDVATWVMGLLSTDDPIIQQKAIHGSRPQLTDDEGVSRNIQRPNRVLDSGLKHSTFNKIRLLCQKDFFDMNPCVLIVPVMCRDEMLEWNGKGYSAIVMAQDGNRIDSVCQGIGVTRHTGNGDKADETLAKQEEVERARFLLEQVVCGLAFSLFRPERHETAMIRHYKDALTDVWRDRRILVPSRSDDDDDGQHFRVKKVTFVDGQHPPPDPLLLAVKAAAIWSQRNQQQLIAHGEVQIDSVDEYDRQMDLQAEEQYWDWLRERYRPNDWNDLAVGLGQPNGYRPDTVDDSLGDSNCCTDDDDSYDLPERL